MINCSNCGAAFRGEASKCPYCGQIYIPGAQKEYMDNLQEIREEMSDVGDISGKIYQKEIKKNVRKTGVILVVLILLFVIGIIFSIGINRIFSYQESEEDIKARLLWERENYPVMNTWYEEEDYQTILRFMEDTYEEKGYSCYEWEHYQFVKRYENYQICMEIRERIENHGEVSKFDAGELLYCGMSLLNYESENYGYVAEQYSESEKKKLKQWKLEVESIFFDTLMFSKEELTELQNVLYKEGYLSYEACCEHREEILERVLNEM